jgi:hypothetical protein
LDWCWHGIGYDSYSVGTNSEYGSDELAITGPKHYDLIGSFEHRCRSDPNHFWKPLQRIAIIVVMQMEHHRQAEQPHKMHQDYLANGATASGNVDVN